MDESQTRIKKSKPAVFYLNIFILILAIAGVFGYIVLSNRVVADKYSARLLNNEYAEANIDYEMANTQINEVSNMDALMKYAQNKGMVDSNDAASIFENSGVAAINHNNQ